MPLAKIIDRELADIKNALGQPKLEQSWIGGLIIKSHKLDREGKNFQNNLEAFNNKKYLKAYNDGNWAQRKKDFIELYKIVQTKQSHIICPIKIVAEIMRYSFIFNADVFNMKDAKNILKFHNFSKNPVKNKFQRYA